MDHWLEKVILLLQAPTKDLRELARIAGADPKTFYLGVNPDGLDKSGQDLSGMDFSRPEDDPDSRSARQAESTRLVQKIREVSRQEERIAILLDAILRDRATGIRVLDAYQFDKAKFATYALEQMRTLFTDTEVDIHDETIVASLIARFFSYTYPLNRGRLLYFMARYLAKYPLVNQAINNSLNKTASMFVDEYRAQIKSLLQGWRPENDF